MRIQDVMSGKVQTVARTVAADQAMAQMRIKPVHHLGRRVDGGVTWTLKHRTPPRPRASAAGVW